MSQHSRQLHRSVYKPAFMGENELDNGADDLDEYTFTLSAEEDEELIDELDRAEQGGRLNEHIRNLLRLGHNVHLAATFSTNQEIIE